MSAEPLLEELLAAASAEEQARLLRQERFHSPGLAQLLLQESAKAQLQATGEALRLAELALATIDLLALQSAAGEIPSVVPFRRDFEEFEPEDGGTLALTALDRLFAAGAEDPWDRSWGIGAWLLRTLRFSRIRTRPIPFA